MTNNNQTNKEFNIHSERIPVITESYVNMLRKKQEEFDGSVMGKCTDSHVLSEACRRVIANNISNASFFSFSADELRKEIDEELVKCYSGEKH